MRVKHREGKEVGKEAIAASVSCLYLLFREPSLKYASFPKTVRKKMAMLNDDSMGQKEKISVAITLTIWGRHL